jgi:hypothetical protein
MFIRLAVVKMTLKSNSNCVYDALLVSSAETDTLELQHQQQTNGVCKFDEFYSSLFCSIYPYYMQNHSQLVLSRSSLHLEVEERKKLDD